MLIVLQRRDLVKLGSTAWCVVLRVESCFVSNGRVRVRAVTAKTLEDMFED